MSREIKAVRCLECGEVFTCPHCRETRKIDTDTPAGKAYSLFTPDELTELIRGVLLQEVREHYLNYRNFDADDSFRIEKEDEGKRLKEYLMVCTLDELFAHISKKIDISTL